MIDRDEFSAWLRLLETPGVGREAARALLAAFGSPEAVLRASTEARKAVVPPGPAAALAQIPEQFEARLGAGWQWLTSGDEARDVVALGDPRYPQAPARQRRPAAALLRARPHRAARARRRSRSSAAATRPRKASRTRAPSRRTSAAPAGSSSPGWRSASTARRTKARSPAAAARSPSSAPGSIVVYPVRHRALAQKIATDGLLVSEFAVGTPALAENFPIRNRIIAGAGARHAGRRGRRAIGLADHGAARRSRPAATSSRSPARSIRRSRAAATRSSSKAPSWSTARTTSSRSWRRSRGVPPRGPSAARDARHATPSCQGSRPRRARLRSDRPRRADRPHRPERRRAVGPAARPRAAGPGRSPSRPAVPARRARLKRSPPGSAGQPAVRPCRAIGKGAAV